MTWFWIYLIIGGVLSFLMFHTNRDDERLQKYSPGVHAIVFLVGAVIWPVIIVVFFVLIVRRIINYDISKRG